MSTTLRDATSSLEPFRVHDALLRTCRAIPHRPALRCGGDALTYEELGRCVEGLAAGLSAKGVRPGTHVGLYLPNSAQYVVCFFAVLATGATVVNLSTLDTELTIAKKLADSGARWLIALDRPELARTAKSLASKLPIQLVLAGDEDLRPACRNGRGEPGALRMSGLMQTPPAKLPAGSVDDLAVLQYTGGTTGEPKGAMLLHRNLSIASAQLQRVLARSERPFVYGQERILLALPLFHIFAVNAGLLLSMRLGAELLIQERFDPVAAIETIEAHRVTVFSGVPTMFTAILDSPGIQQRDLRSLKFCAGGGAPLIEETARRFADLTGVRITDGWGMTETCGMGTICPMDAPPRPGSCGQPVAGIDLRLMSLSDPHREAPPGQPGQIAVRGPNLMAGYWRREQATREAMTDDGFFLTGDVGTVDADGHLRIVDRIKDMLICSGYNVYPRVIEEAIAEHPEVQEVCVIGVPDGYRGQAPKAFIRLRKGGSDFTIDALKEFLKLRLGKHEMVHHFEIRDALPRTLVGKLSKQALIQEEQRRNPA